MLDKVSALSERPRLHSERARRNGVHAELAEELLEVHVAAAGEADLVRELA